MDIIGCLKAEGYFVIAFRNILQCRDTISDTIALWDELDFRSHSGGIERHEVEAAKALIARAEAISRECYRADILDEFEAVFGRSYDAFWASLEQLKELVGGAS